MSYRTHYIIIVALLLRINLSGAQTNQSALQIGLLKYNGGGDWYANPTSLPNLVEFCNKNLGTKISTKIETVDAGDPSIFNYPFLHMTGHGNVIFSNDEAENLRNYLLGGGFLHIDDNYGMGQVYQA